VISSSNIQKSILKKYFSHDQSLLNKITDNVYKAEWITECVKLKSLISAESHKINFNEVSAECINIINQYEEEKPINQESQENQEKIQLELEENLSSSLDSSNLENINMVTEKEITSLDNEDLQINTQCDKQELYSYNLNTYLQSKPKGRLNELIIDKLEMVLDYYVEQNDRIRVPCYRNSINKIKSIEQDITSFEQIKKLVHLGKQTIQKVKEIIFTGGLKRTEFLRSDEKYKVIKVFEGVYGIGQKLADRLYSKGLRTIDDLRKNTNMLNKIQKVGLKYYDEMNTRIPRSECDEILCIIKTELYNILPEEIIHIELCGSYRRGKESCGDIDVLITRKDDGSIDGILTALTAKLQKINLIREYLSESVTDKLRYQTTILCKYKENPHRQVDIKVYHKDFFYFALLFFTGSKQFNRNMRLHAKKIGYALTDLSLEYVGEEGKTQPKPNIFIKCESEEQIFDVLGLEYKTPFERDI
jgi:DNA polymerase lambda